MIYAIHIAISSALTTLGADQAIGLLFEQSIQRVLDGFPDEPVQLALNGVFVKCYDRFGHSLRLRYDSSECSEVYDKRNDTVNTIASRFPLNLPNVSMAGIPRITIKDSLPAFVWRELEGQSSNSEKNR